MLLSSAPFVTWDKIRILIFFRLQAVGDSLLLDEHGKSTAEVLEYAKESAAEVLDYAKESKCGSSFLREALAKMHFSTAEAS